MYLGPRSCPRQRPSRQLSKLLSRQLSRLTARNNQLVTLFDVNLELHCSRKPARKPHLGLLAALLLRRRNIEEVSEKLLGLALDSSLDSRST